MCKNWGIQPLWYSQYAVIFCQRSWGSNSEYPREYPGSWPSIRTGLSIEADYHWNSISCESSSHWLLGHVGQQILENLALKMATSIYCHSPYYHKGIHLPQILLKALLLTALTVEEKLLLSPLSLKYQTFISTLLTPLVHRVII